MATFTPQVTKLAKLVPGYLKWNFITKYPCTIHKLQFGTFLITFGKLQFHPSTLEKLRKRSSGVSNCNTMQNRSFGLSNLTILVLVITMELLQV